MRGAASAVAAAFPILTTVVLAVVLVVAAAIVTVPLCHCALPFALATTVNANLTNAIATISSHCHHVALVLLGILCYCPRSCRCHIAPALAAVVDAALPPAWPLLPSPPTGCHPS
jgi:hypothetical protein